MPVLKDIGYLRTVTLLTYLVYCCISTVYICSSNTWFTVNSAVFVR